MIGFLIIEKNHIGHIGNIVFVLGSLINQTFSENLFISIV